MHDKEYVYFIPFEQCKIAGDIFTLLVIGQYEIDKERNITYWSSCERYIVCQEKGLNCFYTKYGIDLDSDMPFDIAHMTDHILKNGNRIEYEHYDGIDMLLFYLWEGKYSEQKIIQALQLKTGLQYTQIERPSGDALMSMMCAPPQEYVKSSTTELPVAFLTVIVLATVSTAVIVRPLGSDL